jgi:hypothetical protein
MLKYVDPYLKIPLFEKEVQQRIKTSIMVFGGHAVA